MAIEHEQTYQLRTGDFDRYTHLQPASILDIFQDVAGVNAENIPGMTWNDLTSAGVFWVVTRIKYEIIETPQIHEQVIARTWALAPTRLGFQREYTMRGLDGRMLVKCSSEWVLMDYKTRSFVSAKQFFDDYSYEYLEEKAFDQKLRKIKVFEPQDSGVPFSVAYTDIDLNGHVNNSKYANFAMNALNLSQDDVIKTFQIDYRHELKVDDVISMHTQRSDRNLVVMGTNPESECMFAAKIELVS